MTRNNNFHRFGQFFIGFFQLAVSGAVALHDLFTFFIITNALFTLLLYAGAVSKPSQPIATYVKQPERFQPTNSSW